MSGKTYDILKAIAQLWLPAVGALYFGLAEIWGLPSADEVVGSIVVLTTFLGVVLGISQASFNKSVPPESQVGTPLAVAARHRTGGASSWVNQDRPN